MALLNEILKWTESLPSWQRDACRRLLQKKDGLGEHDYSELFTLLKVENGIETHETLVPVPLSSEHIPNEIVHKETVSLVAMRELENVNLIPSNQILRFSENGITIIYGGNGTGKSGYARVLKRACRARDQSEPILPNAHDPTVSNNEPKAKFDVKIEGVLEEIKWSRDEKTSDRLSTISVFDSKCARAYITTEQDVAYLPDGLDIVENLANQVISNLSEKLDNEIAGIDVNKLPFQHLIDDTQVGKVIGNLSSNSDIDEIITLGTLETDDINRITEIKTSLAEANPLKKAEEVHRSVVRLKNFADKIEKIKIWVNDEAVERFQKLNEEWITAESTETQAAELLRAGENLLPGTGGQQWKMLFEAARRFSTEVAYPGEVFPPSENPSVCPLCQESLPDSGLQRLKRFDEYIKNDIAKTADSALRKVETSRKALEAAELNIYIDEALSGELEALDETIIKIISEFQASLNLRRDSMLKCLKTLRWDEITTLRESPRKQIRKIAAHQFKIYRTLMRIANQELRNKLERELKELTARESLTKCLPAIIELFKRMEKKVALEGCRSNLKTRPISDKSKEFATIAVTDELRKALDYEFAQLGIRHIKTRLKERSIRGKMFHQLVLDLPTSNRIEEILSEGEQHMIALGSFFAELALSNHSCGIVFDDPVSSLDHWHRRNVAHRLVNEAEKRQVIVFTHDTSFLGQLCNEIEYAEIPSYMSFLEWNDRLPGCVNEGLPWDHQTYKSRIDALEKSQKDLTKNWPIYPGENDIAKLRHQYGRLRATLERVIQDVVFNGVIRRYDDWIRVSCLGAVVGFTDSEYKAIDVLHKKCCGAIEAHDPASAKAESIPSAEDFGHDIESLKQIIETIKIRRKAINQTQINS